MNFNIYLDDETGEQLNDAAVAMGETRNALIRRAVCEWLGRRGVPQWPNEVLEHAGSADSTPFESHRNNLKAPADDPLA